jgi:FkbM family methyltransferase
MPAEHDVDLLVRDAFFPNEKGILVEVGAARPDYLSIGASFRNLGWKIISIEPNPEFCAAHRALGYNILEYACSDEDANGVDFYLVNSLGDRYLDGSVSFESFSSLGINEKYAAIHDSTKTSTHKIRVDVRKLDTLLSQYEPDVKEIDILAVDVEGWELKVMRGFNLQRYKPKVLIIENLFDDPEYVAFLRNRGYQLWRRINPNDVYVRADLRKLIPRRTFRKALAEWLTRTRELRFVRRLGGLRRLALNTSVLSGVLTTAALAASAELRTTAVKEPMLYLAGASFGLFCVAISAYLASRPNSPLVRSMNRPD